jgi:hypothetical protein
LFNSLQSRTQPHCSLQRDDFVCVTGLEFRASCLQTRCSTT